MTNSEIIEKAFLENNITLTQSQIKKFEKFYELLIDYNQKCNVTAITEIKDVGTKHFVDSILGNELLKKNSNVLDIGCGAGFPSVPLAIMNPDINFTLIDSVNKKINFINILKEELDLHNIQAEHTRAQEFCKAQTKEKFDHVITRAVAPLNVLLELSAQFVKINGSAIAYKGANYKQELEDAKNAINKLQLNNPNILEKDLKIDNNEVQKRFILSFTKTKQTPKTYPRPKNLVRSDPL